MKKTLNSHIHIASIYQNSKTGRQQIEYHILPKNLSAERAAIIAVPKNNRSYEGIKLSAAFAGSLPPLL